MIQIPYTKPDRYITCPQCGKSEHSVSHLPIGTRTAWYCDPCGARFRLQVISEDQIECDVIQSQRKERTLVTLRSVSPVTLVVEGMRLNETCNDNEQHEDQERYFYNESTCPVNYLRAVVQVYDEDGDGDPHGIFQFVKTEPWREIK